MQNIISHIQSLLRDEPLAHSRSLEDILSDVPHDIGDLPLKFWDRGVFNHELIAKNIAPDPTTKTVAPGQLHEGTYDGTQVAITEMWSRIERGFGTYCSAIGVESEIPQDIPFEQKYSMYQYQDQKKEKHPYPPHLDVIPSKDQTSQLTIFNALGLLDAATLLPKIIPNSFINKVALSIQEKFLTFINGDPQGELGFTIAQVEKDNQLYRKSGTDIMRGANIGDIADWYSDQRFAQQYFTGTNPTTITLATDKWMSDFKQAATTQKLGAVVRLLENADRKSMYMTDCSYFRSAIGADADAPLINEDPEGNRFSCATVTLFQLHGDGILHPLAIILDYIKSTANSVVIFNKRLSPSDSTSTEKEDWPWRYAKTCAQSADWVVHELTVHLTRTHLVEETTMVATHRNIPEQHIVFQLLSPHWIRTFSLNAAARETLVPSIILPLMGFPKDTGYDFILAAFKNYDFAGSYVPKDLESRGFPVADISKSKYRNYGYGQDMILMWNAIHKFVAQMISIQFTTDAQVAADEPIKNWCRELQSKDGGQIPTFPTITTIASLVDAVTMCIHIASPQHTSINYLQNYYYAFVINKPPALFTPLPTSIDVLNKYKEVDLVKALPIGRQRQWLLASTIPWLLSSRPADENSLINYAASLWNVYKYKGAAENGPQIKQYAEDFYLELRELIVTFRKNSNGMSTGTIPYEVMDPLSTAVAILI